MRQPTQLPVASASPHLDELVAVWPHEGSVAELVCELKYGRATTVVTELAEAMAAVAPAADLVTWVPASPRRRRQRGFDQGELLARAVARRLGLPVRKFLRRSDDTPQTARALEGRLSGPDFVATGRRVRFSRRVLLIDDVCTTGATLGSAAAVLRSRGAGSVHGLVATRATIRPRSAPPSPEVYDLSTAQLLGG